MHDFRREGCAGGTVLEALKDVIADIVKESQRARLDGIGCFKAGLSSRGAETEDKFEVQKHIKGLHLIYQPEKTKQASGKYEKKFLSGARLQRYKEFNNAEESGGGERRAAVVRVDLFNDNPKKKRRALNAPRFVFLCLLATQNLNIS